MTNTDAEDHRRSVAARLDYIAKRDAHRLGIRAGKSEEQSRRDREDWEANQRRIASLKASSQSKGDAR